MTHLSHVTRLGLSCISVFLSSVTFPGQTFHYSKRFVVICEEGIAEVLSDKYPAPPPPEIQNSNAPPSDPGGSIEAGVLNGSNQAEDISLFRNQGLEVYYDMETAPDNVPLFDTPDAYTLFYGHTWVWYGIDHCAMVLHNQNEPSFKNCWIP